MLQACRPVSHSVTPLNRLFPQPLTTPGAAAGGEIAGDIQAWCQEAGFVTDSLKCSS
jgi:hypothetical protein